VNTKYVFLYELSCEEANCIINLVLSSEGFGSFLAVLN